jgi:TolB-like protein
MTATRRLAAILAADVAGYSRLMGEDEEGTLERLKAHRRELIDPKISEHRGRIVKTTGDGILIEFPSVVDAVRCAVEVQQSMSNRNADVPSDQRIEFRVGINLGDIIIDDDDIHGDGVNIAARLEGLAQPGGICVSRKVREEVVEKANVLFEDLGDQTLKNIANPVRVYRVQHGAEHKVRPTLALPDKPSIAVLPFQNMSGDPEQEYFADGIVEEIITALSRFRQLFVIARNSSFTYKGRAVDVKQVGRELGVRYVLEGSVRKAANRLRITGQLIDASTGAHLWADRFEGGLEDVFELQDQVTANVVGAIAPQVERAEIERARRKPTENLDAYDCFLRGLASFNQMSSREANEEGLRLCSRATKLDPEFASAYALAALCYTFRKIGGWRIDAAKEAAEAVRLAQRALVLSKDDAVALAASGLVLAHMGRDLDAGVALTDRALALNPNLAAAWYWSGWIKLWFGEPDTAMERFSRAMRLSPLDPLMASVMQNGLAHAHFFAGRYDEALTSAATMQRELPDFRDGLRITAASNAFAGRLDEARKAMARLRQLDPDLRVSKLRELQGPYRRPEDHARYEEAMRKAGLPE